MEVHTAPDEILEPLPSSSTIAPKPSINVTTILPALIDATFSSTTNISTSVLNASIVSFSDEYFAAASNLLSAGPVVRKAGYYVHTGAWFDGWETRRHNREEFDWVVIKLGVVGRVEGVEIDTAYFNGNEAPAAALDGCFLTADAVEGANVGDVTFQGWQPILLKQNCGPSMRQAWRLSGEGIDGKEFTHLRLKMYPDGGIARLRVYGSVVPPPLSVTHPEAAANKSKPVEDLAAALNGGVAISCSDQHFGVKSNLLLPGRGKDMGDGWETARSRSKGHTDWAVIRLGLKGRSIKAVTVDTKDFRGNFPRAVKVEGWKVEDAKAALGIEEEPSGTSPGWIELVKGEQGCGADKEHVFEGDSLQEGLTLDGQVWTHVKLTMIPDGGVKRVRIWGQRV